MNRESLEKWLVENLKYFSPNYKSKFWKSENQIKIFVELLYVCNMFYYKNLFTSEQVNKFIITELKQFSLLGYSLKNPTFSTAPIIQYKYLAQQNIMNQRLFDKISELHSFGYYVFAVNEPFRLLDNMYELFKLNLVQYDKLKKYIDETIVLKNGNIFYHSEHATYALTHTIFYITDMGKQWLVNIDKQKIKHQLLVLLNYYFFENHSDLIGELLICLKFINVDLNSDEEKFVRQMYNHLAKFQAENGAIMPNDLLEIDKLNDEQFFYKCYHTSLVCLGVMSLYENNR